MHRVFISHHHEDDNQVKKFVDEFSKRYGIFETEIVGPYYDTEINSDNPDYIMKVIRENYLTNSTVTIVMIGEETWKRKYVDWEIASTLRDDPINKRSGLIGIFLPGLNSLNTKIPERLQDNVNTGYAKLYTYPFSPFNLDKWIEDAFERKEKEGYLVDNSRTLYKNNR